MSVLYGRYLMDRIDFGTLKKYVSIQKIGPDPSWEPGLLY